MGKWAAEIIRAELLGEVIARRIAPPTMEGIRATRFPDPYARKTVAAGVGKVQVEAVAALSNIIVRGIVGKYQ